MLMVHAIFLTIPKESHYMQNQKNILVVDDEDALRTALTLELTAKGYTVDTASDGDEAIAFIQIKTFDLVILDIKMARVQGMDVLKYIKSNFPAIKVIMLTAFADLKNAMDSKKYGADDFISKPYDIEDILMAIEDVIGK
jgi:DNA-binding NtrC family response regulator